MKKANKYVLSPEMAGQMLSNVFDQCGQSPNDVPLDVLQSYSNYRRERYNLQRSVIVTILIIFLLLPFFFVAPRLVVTLREGGINENPTYNVSVSTRIPVQEIQAMISGRNMPMYESASHAYVVQPNRNGTMRVTATLINKQYTMIELTITNVDSDAPQLVTTDIGQGVIRLYVTDPDSGIDFDSIRLTRADGELRPREINRAQSFVALDYPEEPVDVRIPDKRGNELLITLRPE